MEGEAKSAPENRRSVFEYSGNLLLDLDEVNLSPSDVDEAIQDQNRVVDHDPTGPGLIILGETVDHNKLVVVLKESGSSTAPSEAEPSNEESSSEEPSSEPRVWQVLAARPASPVEREIYTRKLDG